MSIERVNNPITECITQTDLKECFISSTGLEKTKLVWNFFSMVECSGATVNGITPLNFSSDFAIGMLKAFEEFDQNLNPTGLISQQFTALKHLLQEKKVKLYIGEENGNDEIAVATDKLYKTDKGTKCVFINFSKQLVQNQINKGFFCIQKDKEDSYREYQSLFPSSSEEELLCKCAALFLFHELFHVGSFSICDFDKYGDYTKLQGDYNYLNNFGVNRKMLETLFVNRQGEVQMEADDARNTIWKLSEKREIPGEFELLNALSNVPIIRLYFGKFLDLKDPDMSNLIKKICKNLLEEQKHLPEISHLIEWSVQDIGRLSYVNYLDFKKSVFPKYSLALVKERDEIIWSVMQNSTIIKNQIKDLEYPLLNNSDIKILINVMSLEQNLENLIKVLKQKVCDRKTYNKLEEMFEKIINIPENFKELITEIVNLTIDVQQEKDKDEQKIAKEEHEAMIYGLEKTSVLLFNSLNIELGYFTKLLRNKRTINEN